MHMVLNGDVAAFCDVCVGSGPAGRVADAADVCQARRRLLAAFAARIGDAGVRDAELMSVRERLARLRETMPNLNLQMLLRGRNTVGYTPYPTEVTSAFVHEAAQTGIDVFRIFDALNDVEQMRPAIEAVRATA